MLIPLRLSPRHAQGGAGYDRAQKSRLARISREGRLFTFTLLNHAAPLRAEDYLYRGVVLVGHFEAGLYVVELELVRDERLYLD